MKPWYWVLLLIGANLGVWAIEEAFEFRETLAVEGCFLGACGVIYVSEMWDTWRKKWRGE